MSQAGTAEGRCLDNLVDAAFKLLRNQDAIEFGLEDSHVIRNIDEASFNLAAYRLAPSELRIEILSHNPETAYDEQNPARESRRAVFGNCRNMRRKRPIVFLTPRALKQIGLSFFDETPKFPGPSGNLTRSDLETLD
jgi:hypothetical protein